LRCLPLAGAAGKGLILMRASMLGKTLGLDISDDAVTAVLVKGGLQGYQLMGCATESISRAGSPEAALSVVLGQVDAGGCVCISGIPSDRASYRNLTLPFKDRRKIGQIIAYELESLLPFPVEDLLVDFTITGQSVEQTEILAAAVKRSFLAGYLDFLQKQAVKPEVVDIGNVATVMLLLKEDQIPANGLFIDLGRDRATIVLFLNGRIVMIRNLPLFYRSQADETREKHAGDAVPASMNEDMAAACQRFCRTVRNTLMAFVNQTEAKGHPEKVFISGAAASQSGVADLLSRFLELAVEVVDLGRSDRIQVPDEVAGHWDPGLMNTALALALRESRHGAGFNFRKEEFEPKRQFLKFRKDLRKGAIVMAVIIALVMCDYGVDYYGMKKRYNGLDRQIAKIFTQTLPEVKKIDEMRETAGIFAAGGKGHSVLDLLADISRRVPSSLDVVVSRVVIDPEEMVIRGTTDTFNTVDSIKQGLGDSPFFRDVTITSANLERSGNRVQFEMRSELVH
jgi:general secretion pathway protein L